MKRILFAVALALSSMYAVAQSVPFPPNPGITNKLEPWGYQQLGTSWDTSPYLPFIYNGAKMRLMPPNGVTYNSTTKTWTFSEPGKKYPLILFFHGAGEKGTDNNMQLIHGGQIHKNAVLSGAFPGFLVYPQSVTHQEAKGVIERILVELPVDYNRIYVHGLSNGGGDTWKFLVANPTLVAAAFPMSASDDAAKTQTLLYTPLRQAQGGLDTNPVPGWTQTIVDWFNTNGGHLEYFFMPNTGHGTWDTQYNRADFFPWFLSQKKNKIMVRYDRNLLCPGAPISVDMGFTPGFEAYEWRKDGVVIPGATSSKLIATSYGTYDGRIKNRGVWTAYADPIVVGVKPVTNTPPIQVNGVKSIFLPDAAGNTTTDLTIPGSYVSYSWKNASNTVVSTTQVYTGAPVGTYTVTANELNGCSTNPSPAFSVKAADGPNKPDAISDLIGYATSQSATALAWADNPSPAFNETGFEIYRSTSAGSGYTLIAITGADVLTYADAGLNPNTTYYYKIRPINQYSAGPTSAPVGVVTLVDNVAPTAPTNLKVTGTTATSVSLSWTPSTDNAAVYRYDIFKDGVKTITTDQTTATVYNLVAGTNYRFTVKARDITGNYSPESSIVIAAPTDNGFTYKYYELTSTPSALPNFNNLTPVKTGWSALPDVSVRNRDTNFAFMWTGNIYIPVAGNYTFGTNSDDGSKLYIGTYNEANLVVNNDGGHGAQDREGTKNFATAGLYPIVVTYFQGGGGFAWNSLWWKNNANGQVSKVAIPASQFGLAVPVGGTPPAVPSNLVATATSFDQISLTWTDNSTDESGFRIYRSTNATGPFNPVGQANANATSYVDKDLAPATKYYYQIRSFGQYGESGANPARRGLDYAYYEAYPPVNSLSGMTGLTPVKTGVSQSYDVALRGRNENFYMTFKGQINITTAGTYRFYVASDDGSALYFDGALLVSNDTDGALHEANGTKTGVTVGLHDLEVRWRKKTSSSSRLNVYYQRTTSPTVGKTQFTASNVPGFFTGTEVNATTNNLPATPAVPGNLAASNVQPRALTLTWLDNSTTETSYVILRSYRTNTSFVSYKTLPANTSSFTDTGLFPNAAYYYKVQASGPGGNGTTNELLVNTGNSIPDLTALTDFSLKYGKTKTINLLATEDDEDPIVLSATGLPAFATLNDHGDGSGTIVFNPAVGDLGEYNITVTASDNHSGSESSTFKATITDKDVPEVLPINNVTVAEGSSTTVQIGANSDFGAQNLTWSFEGLPSFASYTVTNGLVSVVVAPDFIHSGPYTVTATATDPLNASSSKSFTINVTDVDPDSKVYVNMVYSTTAAAPWNNVNGLSTSSLKNAAGATTPIGLQFQTTAWSTWFDGAQTGNNSGVFPDAVMKDYYYFGIFGNPETVDVKVTGLNPARSYNFSFLAASQWTGVTDNGTTVYTIGGTSASVYAQNNTTNTANINGVTPAADGSVTFTMSKASGTPVGYLNAFTFETIYQPGTAPAAPRNVAATFNTNHVDVTWIDAPFNETGFDVYRAESEAGTYTKIGSAAKNATTYADNNLVDGATYFYKVKAVNATGESAFSNAAPVSLPVLPPALNISGSLTVPADQASVVTVTTDTDATLVVSGLPSFASQVQVNAYTVNVTLSPATADIGAYSFTATANDGAGGVATQTINGAVTENVLYRVMVNFNSGAGSGVAPSPWNNTNDSAPNANDTYSNLLTTTGTNSGLSLKLLNSFGGSYNEAASTGNNSGVVPDAVLSEYYWFGMFGAPNEVNMTLSGLTSTNRYRIKFVASSKFSYNGTITDNGYTTFKIGTKTTSVNVQANTTTLGVIDGVVASATGTIDINVSKGAGASAGFVNGIIIEAFPVDQSAFNPSNLTAAGLSSTQIKLQWSDNSPSETGYEIQRSTTGQDGSYSVIGTVGADVTTYTDAVAASSQIYYYKVRATTSGDPSPFTNVAKAGAVAFKIYVNISMNATYDAPAPWNNVSTFAGTGTVFYGFKDANGSGTGLRLRIQHEMDGSNNWGINTGNNSGIFPDKVLNSFWYTNAYQPIAEFVVDGLDQTFSYNFGFMGAIDVATPVNTDFSINGNTVTNQNNGNISNVSYLRSVKPSADGEVLFTVKESAGSPWSIFNAFVIEGYPTGGNASARKSAIARDDGNMMEVRFGEATNRTTVYPNPVDAEMTIHMEDASLGDMKYEVLDQLGRVVLSGKGVINTITSDLPVSVDLPKQLYILKTTYPDGKFTVNKFIKN